MATFRVVGSVDGSAATASRSGDTYIKIARSGSTVTVSYSADGDSWTPVKSATMSSDDVTLSVVFSDAGMTGAVMNMDDLKFNSGCPA